MTDLFPVHYSPEVKDDLSKIYPYIVDKDSLIVTIIRIVYGGTVY